MTTANDVRSRPNWGQSKRNGSGGTGQGGRLKRPAGNRPGRHRQGPCRERGSKAPPPFFVRGREANWPEQAGGAGKGRRARSKVTATVGYGDRQSDVSCTSFYLRTDTRRNASHIRNAEER